MSQTQPKLDHASTPAPGSIPPLRKTVRVSLTPERAFRRFTESINDWWPLPGYSVGQEKSSHIVFGTAVGEHLVEYLKDGSTCVWGRILEWDPGRRVVFTWHPGAEESERQQVSVSFIVRDGATEVELVHSGWEVYGDEAAEKRGHYDAGWAVVLEHFEVS